MKTDRPHRYDDIIDLPHWVSEGRPHMSRRDRAAQFSPFAALSGYGAAIKETARLTEERSELGEDDINALDEKLAYLKSVIRDLPLIKVTYFAQDPRKEGGAYKTYEGRLKKIDGVSRTLVFTGDTVIPTEDIRDMELLDDYKDER